MPAPAATVDGEFLRTWRKKARNLGWAVGWRRRGADERRRVDAASRLAAERDALAAARARADGGFAPEASSVATTAAAAGYVIVAVPVDASPAEFEAACGRLCDE